MSEIIKGFEVDNGVRKIGVNKEGEYIELSVNDRGLYERFAGLMNWFEIQQEIMDGRGNELAKKYGNEPIMEKDEEGNVNVNTEAVLDVIKTETEFYRECCVKIDEVFGAECCRKVFGNIIPDSDLIGEFFEKITPILQTMSEERGEKIAIRYDRNKKKRKQRSKEELIAAYKEE